MKISGYCRVAAVAACLIVSTPSLAQDVCPEGYPIDCGGDTCCPLNTYCLPEGGCAPDGWSSCGGGSICPPGLNLYCPRIATCYSNYDDLAADGCTFEESTVCGVPAN